MSNSSSPDWEFTDRDIAILRELAADPQLSSRELTCVLEAEYGIDVSHVTVSQSIRRMREEGVFREAIVPNEEFYIFALFEFKFNSDGFAQRWREAMEFIRAEKHTLFFFLATGTYQWKTVMMFREQEDVSRWIHECYKEYGDVFENIRSSAVHNVLKFRTDPRIYEELRTECP